jgi:glutamyl-Q tRNA(Asp) synthetase
LPVSQTAGRFAPSPTGPLHAGSLLAATASYLDARTVGNLWLVRIDDLDVDRNVAGAESAILRTLEAHGLTWDRPVIRQSERLDRYRDAIAHLIEAGHVFYCTCSRSRLKGRRIYPGFCRARHRPVPNAAIRLRVPDAPVSFHDLIAGPHNENLARSCGDFVIRRRDGIFAYQLATAVDDGDPLIARVVRGGDLLDNTARQIYLMRLLGLHPPEYAHLPVLVRHDGRKLSKQTHAPAIDDGRAGANLARIFGYLGIESPDDAARWTPAELIEWGTARWSVGAVRSGELPVDVSAG